MSRRPPAEARWRADPITAVCTFHGEGPVWDVATGRLLVVDMLAGDVLALDPSGGRPVRIHVGEIAAALRPRRAGGYVLADARGFCLLDADLAPAHRFGELWTDRRVRMNEGGCDPRGAFYAGSMNVDGEPGAGHLYRLDPDGSSTIVLPSVTTSNGIDWAPDATGAYFVDSATQRIDRLGFDDAGAVVDRQRVVAFDQSLGTPDGLTVDADGCVWVALWGGGRVVRVTPDGRTVGDVSVPTPDVTACAFGGADLMTLYVTTSRWRCDDAGAGRVYACRPGVRGRPPAAFAG